MSRVQLLNVCWPSCCHPSANSLVTCSRPTDFWESYFSIFPQSFDYPIEEYYNSQLSEVMLASVSLLK